MKSELYYESHITIDPVFYHRRELANKIAEAYGFRLANLIMRKKMSDPERPHEDDTFMTMRHKDSEMIRAATVNCVKTLQFHGYKVRRYKIEDTIVDSNISDEMGLL